MKKANEQLKKRWVSLYVENDVGVLAKISGLFSGKSYNLSSLTVGETEDPTVSRMTISLYGDDKTFEQIKKQLNRSVAAPSFSKASKRSPKTTRCSATIKSITAPAWRRCAAAPSPLNPSPVQTGNLHARDTDLPVRRAPRVL